MKENAIMHINALVASRKKTLQCSRRRQKPFLMQDLREEGERERERGSRCRLLEQKEQQYSEGKKNNKINKLVTLFIERVT